MLQSSVPSAKKGERRRRRRVSGRRRRGEQPQQHPHSARAPHPPSAPPPSSPLHTHAGPPPAAAPAATAPAGGVGSIDLSAQPSTGQWVAARALARLGVRLLFGVVGIPVTEVRLLQSRRLLSSLFLPCLVAFQHHQHLHLASSPPVLSSGAAARSPPSPRRGARRPLPPPTLPPPAMRRRSSPQPPRPAAFATWGSGQTKGRRGGWACASVGHGRGRVAQTWQPTLPPTLLICPTQSTHPLAHPPTRTLIRRNEQAAGYAAAAAGFLTGTPAALLTVSGPGAVHGLACLAHAQANCWPVLMLSGSCEQARSP